MASIRGDEASEAQTYVNRLLQAWGWADSVEAGTTFERKIPKGSLAGGMGKADALIEATRATVLIEMKSRGKPLEPHFPPTTALLDLPRTQAGLFGVMQL